MPEYLELPDGSSRQVYPRETKKYAGSILTKPEWEAAIENSKAALLSQQHPPPKDGAVLQPTHILQHLAKLAKTDKAYAWWAAHLFAELDPTLADMPERLTQEMKQNKE